MAWYQWAALIGLVAIVGGWIYVKKMGGGGGGAGGGKPRGIIK